MAAPLFFKKNKKFFKKVLTNGDEGGILTKLSPKGAAKSTKSRGFEKNFKKIKKST